ncbi:hypothetical protein [Microcoleus sp. EPA2]|uniref:hypothetical protein n=1 Tax=Microcoleus sp. EPA2 TaxID=2841654 RepID=UPI00312B80BC
MAHQGLYRSSFVKFGSDLSDRRFTINLSTEGLSREDWVNDFSCRRGEFIVEELDGF